MKWWLVLGTLAVGCASGSAPAARAPASAALRVIGSGPRVAMAELVLDAGASFEVPSSACQDVLALARYGEGRVAPEGGPQTHLPTGHAVRFGHGQARRGVLYGSAGGTTWWLVFARPIEQPFAIPTSADALLDAPACEAPADGRFQLGEPMVFTLSGGRLEATLVLDRVAGADWAGLGRLDGAADLAVPEHVHEESAEVLYFEDGEGRMRLGDAVVDVRPGVFVYVPEGTPHGLSPSGARPLHAIQVYAPAGPEQRFRTPSP